jgi:hypothetical protein
MPDDRDYERYDQELQSNRHRQEEAELEEWRQWAESWLHEIDEEGGAGEVGTDDLTNEYKRQTPGQ